VSADERRLNLLCRMAGNIAAGAWDWGPNNNLPEPDFVAGRAVAMALAIEAEVRRRGGEEVGQIARLRDALAAAWLVIDAWRMCGETPKTEDVRALFARAAELQAAANRKTPDGGTRLVGVEDVAAVMDAHARCDAERARLEKALHDAHTRACELEHDRDWLMEGDTRGGVAAYRAAREALTAAWAVIERYDGPEQVAHAMALRRRVEAEP
jgi:hypothetical protein